MNPLVSIVIDNYNYGRYLGAAIDSALAQTWQPLEVIVVDDGSTDHSPRVMARYGERIHAIVQPNGGQGAAYNSGFAASRGEWVLFLDSDDLLDADAIERMMALAEPGVAKVQGYLERIGPEGEPLGGVVPFRMHDGDVGGIARRFRQYASPPGSGNLFRRSAIEPYFPMRAADWRRSADTVPILLAALHGRVASVGEPIGSYRLHLADRRAAGLVGNIDRSLAGALRQAEHRRRLVQAWGSERGGHVWPDEWLMPPWDCRTRAMSWRLQRGEHPYPQDTRDSIRAALAQSLAAWPGYSALERGMLRAWLEAMLCLPRTLTGMVARENASGRWRARLRRWRGGQLA